MLHTTRNAAQQCNAVQSLDRGVSFGFAFGLKSGMRRPRGAYCALTVPAAAQLAATCLSLQTRRRLRSRLPGMMLHAHVAFRFRCVLGSLTLPRFPCPVLPAYRRARERCLAGWLSGLCARQLDSSSVLTPSCSLVLRAKRTKQIKLQPAGQHCVRCYLLDLGPKACPSRKKHVRLYNCGSLLVQGNTHTPPGGANSFWSQQNETARKSTSTNLPFHDNAVGTAAMGKVCLVNYGIFNNLTAVTSLWSD